MGKFGGYFNPFDVYLTPLHNDDPIGGEWVRFPTTAEHLREVFQNLKISPSEWAIAGVADHVDGIHYTIQGCQNLDELNHLAVKLEDMDERDLEQFRVLTSLDQYNDTVAELINLCDNLDCYDYYDSISDDEDLGRYWLFHEADLDRSTLREIEDYIDFECYGHDIRQNNEGLIADNCYVVPNNTYFHEYYSGDPGDIPEENRVTTLLVTPELDEDERLERAIELAVELDSFFRNFDPDYAATYSDIQKQQEAICDNLYDGKIARYDAMLEDLGQDAHDVLPAELAEYKAAIRYDPEQDPRPEVLRVLVVEPRKVPYARDILAGQEGLAEAVKGPIAAKYPFEDMVALVYNDEAKDMGYPLNRALYNDQGQPCDVIPGTFLVVGLGEDRFTSLSEDLMDKYAQQFQTVEVFAQVGGRTVMFKVPPEKLGDISDDTLDRIIRSGADVKKPSIRERLEAARKEISGRQTPTLTKGRAEPEH